MAARSQPPTGSRLPPRAARAQAPLSVQIARASWQFVGITAVVAGITFTVGKRDPTVRSIAEIIVGAMMAIAVGFGIYGLVAFSRQDPDDEEESALRSTLLKNSLAGFGAVAVLLAIAIPVFLGARRDATNAARATPVPTAVVDASPSFTPRTVTSGGQTAAASSPRPAGGPEIIAVDEGRTFARSYVTLIQRSLFDEAYKYLPADVRGRVSAKQHQDLWLTAAGVDREEIVIADATEAAGGRAVEVKIQVPGKPAPQVLVVQKAGEKMWATPRQFVSP